MCSAACTQERDFEGARACGSVQVQKYVCAVVCEWEFERVRVRERQSAVVRECEIATVSECEIARKQLMNEKQLLD